MFLWRFFNLWQPGWKDEQGSIVLRSEDPEQENQMQGKKWYWTVKSAPAADRSIAALRFPAVGVCPVLPTVPWTPGWVIPVPDPAQSSVPGERSAWLTRQNVSARDLTGDGKWGWDRRGWQGWQPPAISPVLLWCLMWVIRQQKSSIARLRSFPTSVLRIGISLKSRDLRKISILIHICVHITSPWPRGNTERHVLNISLTFKPVWGKGREWGAVWRFF